MPKHEKMYPTFSFQIDKEYKARWGSCSSSGDVTYNWRIIIAPHHIVDYIVVHELCHLLEHNNSSKYWKLVESYCKDYQSCCM